jgi:hypothetical protein
MDATCTDICCGASSRGTATYSLELTMRQLSTILSGACLLCTTLFAHAQTSSDAVVDPVAAKQQAREIAQGDPARWYREDATRQAQLRTLQKEMGAALQEASNACKKAPAAERNACLAQARATYQRDLAQARAQLDSQGQTP